MNEMDYANWRSTVDMMGFETTTDKKYDPMNLSPNQKAVYDIIVVKPRKYAELYPLCKDIMPESSVRRIMASLLLKGLAEKTKSGRWRLTK